MSVKLCAAVILCLAALAFALPAHGAAGPPPDPQPDPAATAQPAAPGLGVSLQLVPAESPEDINLTLKILVLLTVLSLAPSIILMMTSFTRLIIVLSMTRHALGTQTMPPNQVLIGLALFLTFFIMRPVGVDINNVALQPYFAGEITFQEALDRAQAPLREFMISQTRAADAAMLLDASGEEMPDTWGDIPIHVLIPAFVISELKSAFQIGFVIFIPFLVIDMVVASTLMSMGMMMLPPIIISLPFKVLLFVLVDGWHLITAGMLQSFAR